MSDGNGAECRPAVLVSLVFIGISLISAAGRPQCQPIQNSQDLGVGWASEGKTLSHSASKRMKVNQAGGPL